MASRHLHELLKEEQEPFALKNFINERRCHLTKPASKTHHRNLHLRAPRPMSQNPSLLSNFRKAQPCFFHSCDPEPSKSPVFDFPKSPRRNSNTLLLNVPSITAALLLESALRIQKQSSHSKKLKNRGFGLFGTMLKRLVVWKTQKREIYMESLPWDSLKDLQRLAERRVTKETKMEVGMENNKHAELGFSSSFQRSNQMEESEEESMDMERDGCCCSRKEGLRETVLQERTNDDSWSCEKGSCSSPFRFQGLEREPESSFSTPEFGSPDISPCQPQTEASPSMSSGQNGSTSSQETDREYTAGEEKEQSSPVSVLEPPFQDDLEVHGSEDYEADEEDEGNFENNLAAIQRVKRKLLKKIQRFERLADLDPLELEKLLVEEANEEEEEETKERRYHNKDKELQALFDYKRMGELKQETQKQERKYQCLWRIPCDIMTESWNDTKTNNIQDLLLEVDFGRGDNEWRGNGEELQEIAKDVELTIFGFLIRELSLDLLQSKSL